jgi:metal-responsive CopG/Arc/MetJ family transcriptional regulator
MGRPALNYIRTHISIDKKALQRLDAIVGEKGRAAFIRKALDQALDTVEEAQRIAAKSGKRDE